MFGSKPTVLSKMADFADETNFDELCTKCEQMELDVSKIDLT